MHGNNGIARAANGTLYVANALKGGLYVLEEQANNTLVLEDFVPVGKCHHLLLSPHVCVYKIVDRSMDNLSIDSDGFVWSAGSSPESRQNLAGVASLILLLFPTPTQIAFPKALTLVYKHFSNPSIPSPTTALRFSMNTDPGAARRGGEKYKVERVSAHCNQYEVTIVDIGSRIPRAFVVIRRRRKCGFGNNLCGLRYAEESPVLERYVLVLKI